MLKTFPTRLMHCTVKHFKSIWPAACSAESQTFKDFTLAEIDNRPAIAWCGYADALIDADNNPDISRMADRTVAESPELGDTDVTVEADYDVRSESSGSTTICDSPLEDRRSTDILDESASSLTHSPPDVLDLTSTEHLIFSDTQGWTTI